MSDFEYLSLLEEEVPFSHLTCSLCQSLAVLPVRLQHVVPANDCGTVTCLECFRRWVCSSKGQPIVYCPRCRRQCPHPTDDMAIPDRLLGRMLGHLQCRCLFCRAVHTVEDMMAHSRACPLRRLHYLQQTHRNKQVDRAGQVESCGASCEWGDILGEDLLPQIPNEVRGYIREWMKTTIMAGERYASRACFRNLLNHAPQLILETWVWCWSQDMGRMGPSVWEMCQMFDLLPYPEKEVVAKRLEMYLQEPGCFLNQAQEYPSKAAW